MPSATIAGIDTAGGLISPAQTRVTIAGMPWAVVGSPVAPHGTHGGSVMIDGVAWVRIDGAAVCVAGSLASCSDAATGSAGWINAG